MSTYILLVSVYTIVHENFWFTTIANSQTNKVRGSHHDATKGSHHDEAVVAA